MTKFSTERAAFLGAIREFLPIVPGVIPFGIVYGVAATDIGMTPFEGIIMSIFMLAGAAQLVTIELLGRDAALWVILVSATVVNLRFIIYSASLSQYLKPYSLQWRLFLGYLLTDQPYALSIAYFTENPDAPHKQWYHFGHSLMLWTWWVIASAMGLFLGDVIPSEWNLTFAIPLMFLAIAVPAIKDWTYLLAGSVSAIVAVLAVPLPNNTGLLLAVACGLMVGVILGKDES
ncbi:MAG: AzlC family ABC transporter permease [Chloroflexota bacterium]